MYMIALYKTATLVLLGCLSFLAGFNEARGEELRMPLGAECDLRLRAGKKHIPQGSKCRKHCSEEPSASGNCGGFYIFVS